MKELRQVRLESSEWSKIFIYDESSPSCLLWNPKRSTKSRKTHRDGKVAGSFCTGQRQRYWRANLKLDSGKNRQIMVHRIVWEMHNFKIPKGFEIDHVDGDSSNNKIDNLRCVPMVVNKRNRGICSHNKHGMAGISITSNGKSGHLYATASWTENGKHVSKRFSIAKLGEGVAIKMAKEFRTAKILEINAKGFGYTERHYCEGSPTTVWQDYKKEGTNEQMV